MFTIGGDIRVPIKFNFPKYLDLGTEILKTDKKVFKLQCGSVCKFKGKLNSKFQKLFDQIDHPQFF